MIASAELFSPAAASAPARLMDEMARLYVLSRAIHVVAELGVADHVGAAPVAAAEIAERTQTHARSLERLLRYLSAYRIFEEPEPGRFRGTALSDVLRRDHPESIRPNLRRIGEAWWNAAGHMIHSLRTGESAFPHANGVSFFEYLAGDPEQQKRFDEGMAQTSDADDAAVAEAYDFSRFRRIVDVGGGRGGLLAQILTRAPAAQGVLFDQPQVVAQPGRLAEGRLLDRCELVGGDVFSAVPEGGDCYMIKGMLHDFSDDACVDILRNCRQAMAGDGRVLVAERFLPSSGEGPHPILTLDIQMMVLLSGRERTEAEWHEIFRRAGLAIVGVHDTAADFTVVEGARI